MLETILPTKLHIPRRQPGALLRPRLLLTDEQLRAATLVLVSAPAGYGKTTLVTSWIRQPRPDDGLRFCRLALDEDDNDPYQFFLYPTCWPPKGPRPLCPQSAPSPP